MQGLTVRNSIEASKGMEERGEEEMEMLDGTVPIM